MKLQKKCLSLVFTMAMFIAVMALGLCIKPDSVEAKTKELMVSSDEKSETITKKIDLNGDGKKETVKLVTVRAYYEDNMHYAIGKFTLYVNGKKAMSSDEMGFGVSVYTVDYGKEKLLWVKHGFYDDYDCVSCLVRYDGKKKTASKVLTLLQQDDTLKNGSAYVEEITSKDSKLYVKYSAQINAVGYGCK